LNCFARGSLIYRYCTPATPFSCNTLQHNCNDSRRFPLTVGKSTRHTLRHGFEADRLSSWSPAQKMSPAKRAGRGRPRIEFLNDPERHLVALFLAHKRINGFSDRQASLPPQPWKQGTKSPRRPTSSLSVLQDFLPSRSDRTGRHDRMVGTSTPSAGRIRLRSRGGRHRSAQRLGAPAATQRIIVG
jgi:hypothetical protein